MIKQILIAIILISMLFFPVMAQEQEYVSDYDQYQDIHENGLYSIWYHHLWYLQKNYGTWEQMLWKATAEMKSPFGGMN